MARGGNDRGDPCNCIADEFDSGNATDSQVLTADGSGGATWRDIAADGGGASFAFDGATIVMPEAINDSGNIECQVTLTSDGEAITDNAIFWVFSNGAGMGIEQTVYQNKVGDKLAFAFYEASTAPLTVTINSNYIGGTYYLHVMLPNGGVVQSSAFTIVEGPPG